jgi:hypothetical protein
LIKKYLIICLCRIPEVWNKLIFCYVELDRASQTIQEKDKEIKRLNGFFFNLWMINSFWLFCNGSCSDLLSKTKDKSDVVAVMNENKNLLKTITQLTEEHNETVQCSSQTLFQSVRWFWFSICSLTAKNSKEQHQITLWNESEATTRIGSVERRKSKFYVLIFQSFKIQYFKNKTKHIEERSFC